MISAALVCLTSLPLATLLISPLFRKRFPVTGKVLLFHTLQTSLFDAGSLSPARFRALLQFIQLTGYRLGTVEEAFADSAVVSLTFDDAYGDLLTITDELLEQKIPLTVFVPTKFIGLENSWDNPLLRSRRRHLTTEEIRELAKAGVQFGSHGHTHRDLSRLAENDLRQELVESKRILEDLTGQTITCIASPFGKHAARLDAVARKVGYRYGFGSLPTASEGFYRGRISVGVFDSSLTLAAKFQPGLLTGAEYVKAATITTLSRLTPLLGR